MGAVAFGLARLNESSYVRSTDIPIEQPVPFSHEHHVRGLGIDCRNCHQTVEIAASAGIPPTHTCMSCHSQIWTTAEMLEPVRASYRENRPLEWNRVYDVPGFVYFNHAIHVNKGMGCTTCHGQIDTMPLVWKASSLTMEWCLDCHRQPEKFVRPRAEVFNSDYRPPANQLELGRKLVAEYKVQRLTDCYTCHR
ncbi:MAG: cytochrome c3 family protein [Bryobacteraceae bacterium]|nr:cytochrome c3 family protein [Bryobacteraceae bacterium]